jgi:hypothetical protein
LNEARNVANDAQRIALDAPMTRRSIGP